MQRDLLILSSAQQFIIGQPLHVELFQTAFQGVQGVGATDVPDLYVFVVGAGGEKELVLRMELDTGHPGRV